MFIQWVGCSSKEEGYGLLGVFDLCLISLKLNAAYYHFELGSSWALTTSQRHFLVQITYKPDMFLSHTPFEGNKRGFMIMLTSLQ